MARFDSTPRPLDLVRAAEDTELRYEPEGEPQRLELLPAMPESDIERLAARIPCPIPDPVRELLRYTRGFATGPLESLEFGGLEAFEFTEVFPHLVDLAHDGFGNYWVADLTSGSREWGPIYVLEEFARALPEGFEVRDLRGAAVGDGFSWGRYGPRTENRRAGEEPVFAYQHRSRGQRFKDWLGWRHP